MLDYSSIITLIRFFTTNSNVFLLCDSSRLTKVNFTKCELDTINNRFNEERNKDQTEEDGEQFRRSGIKDDDVDNTNTSHAALKEKTWLVLQVMAL